MKLDEVTLVQAYLDAKEQLKTYSDLMADLKARADEIEAKIIDVINKSDTESLIVEGRVFKLKETESIFGPKDVEGRRELSEYITSQFGEDVKDRIFQPHHQSLNALWRSTESKKSLPACSEPVKKLTLSNTKYKGKASA